MLTNSTYLVDRKRIIRLIKLYVIFRKFINDIWSQGNNHSKILNDKR